MTILEAIIIFGVFGVVVWWAHTANFQACEKCTYDCNQGRDCRHPDRRAVDDIDEDPK